MGLDMYLRGKKFIWEDKDRDKFKEFVKKIYPKIDLNPEEIVFEVMYWRKSNAIHKWFVNNVQDGNDDCNEYYVSEEDLKKLLKAIEEVLKDNNKAEELLSTQEGFFFGGTQYDEYYWEDLNQTKKKIKEILDKEIYKEVSLYYCSSW